MRGWRLGFDKVRFTRLLRDGGVDLSEAVELNRRLLDDEEILVRLGQYCDRAAALAAFNGIGVRFSG